MTWPTALPAVDSKPPETQTSEWQSPEMIRITLQLWQETRFLECGASETFHPAALTFSNRQG